MKDFYFHVLLRLLTFSKETLFPSVENFFSQFVKFQEIPKIYFPPWIGAIQYGCDLKFQSTTNGMYLASKSSLLIQNSPRCEKNGTRMTASTTGNICYWITKFLKHYPL